MGEVIIEWVIGGIYVAIRTLYDWIKEKLFGIKDEQKVGIKKIEKKILYKKIRLTENLNNGLKSGLKGVVLEVIDKENDFAEFYDLNGKHIEINEKITFEIGINQFELVK